MTSPAPDHIARELAQAKALFEAGRYRAVGDLVMNLWRDGDGGIDLALQCIQPLLGCRNQRLVAEICEAELARGCEDQRLLLLAGRMALVLGDFDRARFHLCRASDQAPTDGGLLQLLANAQRYTTAEHEDFRRFESVMSDTSIAEAERELAGFALAKACDDIGDFERAANVLRTVNAWAASAARWNMGNWQAFVDVVLRLGIQRLDHPVIAEACPVFIVGLPRSGSTLLADLLGRHPEVCNRQELPWIWLLWNDLVARNGFADRRALSEAASIYLRHLIRDEAPHRWYIDKNPFNFRSLGLISALFPNARIIHCRRGMRDTALSIWQQRFAAREVDFAYRFDHIAGFAKGCERLMAGAERRLGMPIFSLQYEDLIARPKETLSALCRFLGMPDFDPFTIQSGQTVATASIWQVRQPIYGRSIGRWRHYAPFVPELSSMFADDSGTAE